MVGLIVGAVVGAVCGIVPLVYGLLRGEPSLARVGFAACVVSGVLVGAGLTGPVAAVFTWLIWRASNRRHQRQPEWTTRPPAPERGRAGDARTGDRVVPRHDGL
jgi:membrane protein implicated in regulation of membrane protease activity